MGNTTKNTRKAVVILNFLNAQVYAFDTTCKEVTEELVEQFLKEQNKGFELSSVQWMSSLIEDYETAETIINLCGTFEPKPTLTPFLSKIWESVICDVDKTFAEKVLHELLGVHNSVYTILNGLNLAPKNNGVTFEAIDKEYYMKNSELTIYNNENPLSWVISVEDPRGTQYEPLIISFNTQNHQIGTRCSYYIEIIATFSGSQFGPAYNVLSNQHVLKFEEEITEYIEQLVLEFYHLRK